MSPEASELNNLRVIAAHWLYLGQAVSWWRAQYGEIGPDNEARFHPAELNLIRAIDSQPSAVKVEGVVAALFLGRCECSACSDDRTVSAPEHCIDRHGNRLHQCAALEAFDRATAKG